MTTKRSLGFDAFNGVESIFHWDEGEGKFHIENRQDCEPTIEQNKGLQNNWDGYSPSREMRVLADIPVTVIQQWFEEGIDVFKFNQCEWTKRKVLQKLRDPELRHLRVSTGSV